MAGWVEERSEGRWRLNVPGGSDADGERIVHRRMVDAKGEREAKKLLDLFSAEVQKGEYIAPSKFSFKEFAERWLRDYGETNLGLKTLDRYKRMLKSRIVPALGHLKLEQIKPLHLMDFYKNLTENGIREDGKPGALSPKTILHHHRLLSAMFNDAVEWQVINSNPAARVKPPKVKRHQAAYYNEEQTAVLLAAAENEPMKYKVLIILAVFSGLRRGELLGLEWQDINFEKGTLEVRQASQYVPGEGVFTKDPKSESSKRIVALPKFVMEILQEYQKHVNEMEESAGDLWQESEKLFTTWDGRPMHPDTISQWFPGFIRAYNAKEAFNSEISAVRNKLSAHELATLEGLKEQYLKLTATKLKSLKAKMTVVENSIIAIIGEEVLERIRQGQRLPPLPFHGLRHTAATMLINQGLNAKNISSRMGHADIGVTYNIYGHALRSADQEAAVKLNNLYNNKLKKPDEQIPPEPSKKPYLRLVK
jgi:integrase